VLGWALEGGKEGRVSLLDDGRDLENKACIKWVRRQDIDGYTSLCGVSFWEADE
jgi:hypothetical protein